MTKAMKAAIRWPLTVVQGQSGTGAVKHSDRGWRYLLQAAAKLISTAELARVNKRLREVDTHKDEFRKGLYEVRVADNGQGIPDRERERIVVKFVRGPVPRQIGAGLGLAISRQIIERFGGQIYCAQTAKPGSTFGVRLRAQIRRT